MSGAFSDSVRGVLYAVKWSGGWTLDADMGNDSKRMTVLEITEVVGMRKKRDGISMRGGKRKDKQAREGMCVERERVRARMKGDNWIEE